ncbi:MAG: hypothetical protein ABH956_02435 [Candidatus Nealsonbacteria bacterium]
MIEKSKIKMGGIGEKLERALTSLERERKFFRGRVSGEGKEKSKIKI